ncbi:patatin-like phospholipase family protein [Vallitalea pronyensis]|uniref:Patatin-like phospholipase family protein n=1 Tax=Vallitalea pronyensis TaxID=1348613 RepID=A0A8J8MHH0_9FIRM|nr:patatin-like phospholipase family protein [Vallitalea pronyensis]QUI21547.1 patatin-like phospholipase family protein [Vallitalea pronyensis]
MRKQLDPKKEYGVVLEGGGARGAYQAGALAALKSLDVNITAIVGTSVGALNGVLVAQNDIDKAIGLWQHIKYSHVIKGEDAVMEKLAHFDFKGLDLKKVFNKMFQVVMDRGVDITPLKTLIARMVDEDKVRQSGIRFGLVTVSLSDRKPLELFIEDIEEGRLHDFLLASSYLPVFKTEKLHGKRYIDGGFYNNSPTNMLVKEGYKNIIVIKIQGFGFDKKPSMKHINIFEIAPSEDLGGLLEFDKDKVNGNIKLGYYDTVRKINGLRGKYYYLQMDKSERYVLKRLINMHWGYKKKLCAYLRVNSKAPNRGMLEEGIPKLARKLGMKNQWDYSDFIIGVLEHLGKTLGIERFHVYNFDNFLRLVKKSIHKESDMIREDNFTKLLASFIQRF